MTDFAALISASFISLFRLVWSLFRGEKTIIIISQQQNEMAQISHHSSVMEQRNLRNRRVITENSQKVHVPGISHILPFVYYCNGS